jgi:deazaflavin-dependent oxidoreductase (nitroreductase family)
LLLHREPRYKRHMHFPDFMRKVNRVFTNRLLGPLAFVVPPMAVLRHVGRKSGKQYRTPVVAFPSVAGYVIPMTYGQDVDWARNMLKAKGGEVVQFGRRHAVRNPRIATRDEAYRLLPPGVRSALYAANLPGFFLVDRAIVTSQRGASAKRPRH